MLRRTSAALIADACDEGTQRRVRCPCGKPCSAIPDSCGYSPLEWNSVLLLGGVERCQWIGYRDEHYIWIGKNSLTYLLDP